MNLSHSKESKLNVLIYNVDLPLFPGAGGHEYLNTQSLTKWVRQLGLVSLVHTSAENDRLSIFDQPSLTLHLWRNPNLETVIDKKKFLPILRGHFFKKPLTLFYKLTHFLIDLYKQWVLQCPRDTIHTEKLIRLTSKPLSEALAFNDWHAIIVIQSTAAKIIDYIPRSITKILVMHDIRALIYERQIKNIKNPISKLLVKAEKKRFYHFEKKYCAQFDLVVALSSIDEQWIKKNYGPRRTAIIPIPVDINYFRPNPKETEARHRIVFTGHMAHPPNEDAAIYFATTIFPSVRKAIPDAEFHIVGKNPTRRLLSLNRQPGIVITGFVSDTREHIARATLIVVPLRFGSGVRNKILEAWAMEKCIISTALGAEGLKYIPNIHLKIIDDPSDMISEVILCLQNSDYRKVFSMSGRQQVITDHCPENIGKKYFQEVRQVTKTKLNSSRFRIGIDLRWMIPGLAGGIEQAVRAFIHQLSVIDKTNEYLLLLNLKNKNNFKSIESSNIQIHCPTQYINTKKRMTLLLNRIFSKLKLRSYSSLTISNLHYAKELNVDLVYSFPGYIYPDVYSIPNVLTIHDIQHEFFPEFFSDYHLEERRRVLNNSIRVAKHITTVSEYTRKTLIERLKISPDKITTILQAADPIFEPTTHIQDFLILKKYHLQDTTYLLFPAHTWYHKNHYAALKALSILQKKYNLKPLLICTGGKREAHPFLKETIKKLRLTHQVHFLGYLPRHHMPALYRKALSLIYPSLFEGFGIPVLEAMQSGCPVICSHITSLMEIAENAAYFIDPKDDEGICDAIFKVMTDNSLRKVLISTGIQQARKFSWQRHAHETTSLFNKILNEIRAI